MAKPARVLLTIGQDARRLQLRRLLENQQDIIVVAEEFDPLRILVAVAETMADVVILDLPDGVTDPGICSHLLAEFPQLVVLALSLKQDELIVYKNKIVKERISSPADKEILSIIRQARSDADDE